MNTALEYSTRVVQEGGHRCKKSTLNDLVHLTPLRIPLTNPPLYFALKDLVVIINCQPICTVPFPVVFTVGKIPVSFLYRS
jgi:hypothetical protein